MVDLEVRELKKEEFKTWNKLLEEFPYSNIFHRSYWLEASHLNFKIYGVFRESELIGGLPIAYSMRFGIKIAGHPPLTPYLGAIYKNFKGKYITQLSHQKKIDTQLAKKLKEDFDSVSFRFVPSKIDLQSFIWEGFSSSIRYVYRLNIENLDKVWKEMDSRRRRDITHAEKGGLYTVLQDDFIEVYRLVEKIYQKQKIKPKFRKAAFGYHSILKTKNECKSFIVKDRSDKIIATLFIVLDRSTAYALLSGYDYESNHMNAGSLAIWEAIKFSKKQLNLKEFDFCGSMIPRIERYLRKFGGELTPVYSVEWSKPGIKLMAKAYTVIKSVRTRIA